MYRNLKYLITAGAVALLVSGQALACSGNACAANQAAMQQQGSSCPNQAAAPGWSKKHHAMIPGKTSKYVRRMLSRGDEIGLSDAQRRQIEDILVAADKKTAEARARATAVAAEFHGKLRAGGAGEDEVAAYAKRMGELHALRLQANLSASMQASSLLSEEQRSKLYAAMKAGAENK